MSSTGFDGLWITPVDNYNSYIGLTYEPIGSAHILQNKLSSSMEYQLGRLLHPIVLHLLGILAPTCAPKYGTYWVIDTAHSKAATHR